jgi:hypothetical protein
VPAYFDNVLIEKDPGYNMAHWNLHERVLSEKNSIYTVNGSLLVFFHFSHFNPASPDQIASYHTRFSFENRPDLRNLFALYIQRVLANGHSGLRGVRCYYIRNESYKKWRRATVDFIRHVTPLRAKLLLSRFVKA